jgi:hypothetical protein
LKIDKQIKDIADRLNAISNNGNGNGNNGNGRDPPRFYLYKEARSEKWEATVPHAPSDYENTITEDELDYALKSKLRVTPEARFQREKRNWY